VGRNPELVLKLHGVLLKYSANLNCVIRTNMASSMFYYNITIGSLSASKLSATLNRYRHILRDTSLPSISDEVKVLPWKLVRRCRNRAHTRRLFLAAITIYARARDTGRGLGCMVERPRSRGLGCWLFKRAFSLNLIFLCLGQITCSFPCHVFFGNNLLAKLKNWSHVATTKSIRGNKNVNMVKLARSQS
jgi:hypothetical protein